MHVTPDHREAVAAMLDGRVPLKPDDRAMLAMALRQHSPPRPEMQARLRDLLDRARFRVALQEAMR